MLEAISTSWPWYVAGPLIGMMVPLLRWLGGRSFGISSNLRHLCAATLPSSAKFFRYDWRTAGYWNLAFAAGIVVGGFLGGVIVADPAGVELSPGARDQLAAIGIRDFSGLVPSELFGIGAMGSLRGAAVLLGGGFLVGFGARYAGGCTSGHAITGLSDLQLPSLLAVVGFFVGGLVMTHWLLPVLI